MPKSAIYRFLVKVLLWLPVCFAAWFYFAALLTLPVTWFLRAVLPLIMPDVIDTVEQNGFLLDVVTGFTFSQVGMDPPGGQDGLLVFETNPLIYGYGLPLLVGLVLAAPATEQQRWYRIAIAIAVMIPVEIFGVVLDILKTLVFNLGPGVAMKMGLEGWQREVVALGYQFSYLILPAVTPVVLWILMHRDFVETLVPNLRQLNKP